jgi:hypothetical protein
MSSLPDDMMSLLAALGQPGTASLNEWPGDIAGRQSGDHGHKRS